MQAQDRQHQPDGGTTGSAEETLLRAHSCLRTADHDGTGPLRAGIDLGTATCVIVVVDPRGDPVWVDAHPTAALKDGVVVDFAAATEAVRTLKHTAEQALGVELPSAATAYPPCIGERDSRACQFVLEAAGFDEVSLLDEVSAANLTLHAADGVVVDVGGGSTGVGVFQSGRLQALDDRPGGGHHLDLTLAGALGVSPDRAEQLKRAHPDEHLNLLKPGLERIAESIKDLTRGWEQLELHLAGGALMLSGAERVIAKYLGRAVRSYPHALLITPLGIARYAA